MNPDVVITIAFVGIAAMVPFVFLVFVLPQIRRENAGVQQRESSRERESVALRRSTQASGSVAKEEDAPVH